MATFRHQAGVWPSKIQRCHPVRVDRARVFLFEIVRMPLAVHSDPMTDGQPADKLRKTDDAISEDTVILREIEHEFQKLDPGDPRRPALGESAHTTAQELADEAAAASDLAREMGSSD